MHPHLSIGFHWPRLSIDGRRWAGRILHRADLHRDEMHYGHALQCPRRVSDVGRCQDRMYVHLLDGPHWSDVQRLRCWLHQLRDMHRMYYGHAPQRLRRVSDVGRCQDRMCLHVSAKVERCVVSDTRHQHEHQHAYRDFRVFPGNSRVISHNKLKGACAKCTGHHTRPGSEFFRSLPNWYRYVFRRSVKNKVNPHELWLREFPPG